MNSFDKIFEASQRKCGACGETGHNARTCKSKSVPFSTGGYWNEKTFDGLEQLGFPLVDSSHVAMISKIVDGEVLKEPNARVQMPRITWKEEPIKMTWGELDEKCKKQDLVSIGESTYSGAYLRGALAYLPKNTVLTLYTGVHYPLKATFEYGGEEWIFFLAPRVDNWYAENLEAQSKDIKPYMKELPFPDNMNPTKELSFLDKDGNPITLYIGSDGHSGYEDFGFLEWWVVGDWKDGNPLRPPQESEVKRFLNEYLKYHGFPEYEITWRNDDYDDGYSDQSDVFITLNPLPADEEELWKSYWDNKKEKSCSHEDLSIKTIEVLNGELLLTLDCDKCGKRTSTSASLNQGWEAEGLNTWAQQEMTSHGKNVSFKDFIKKEIKSHGNIDIVDWAKHEKQSHKERYGVESFSLDSKSNQSKYMAQDKTWQEKRGYTDDEALQAEYPNYFLLQKYGNDTDAFFSDKLYPYLFIGLSGVDNRTLDMLEDIIYYEPEENMVDKFKLTMDNAREYRKLYYNVYGKYPTAYNSRNYYVAETFGAEYVFTGRLNKYSFETDGKDYVISYGGRRIPSFRLPKDTYFHGKVYTIERFVEELNNNQERAVSDVFNFLWNKTNNGHLDDILMNRAETFESEEFKHGDRVKSWAGVGTISYIRGDKVKLNLDDGTRSKFINISDLEKETFEATPTFNEDTQEYEGTLKETYKDPKTNEIRVKGKWYFPQMGEWVEYDKKGCQFEGCAQMGSPEWYSDDYCTTACANEMVICGKNKPFIDTFMGRQTLNQSWNDGAYGDFCQSLNEDDEGNVACNDCDYQGSEYGAETFESEERMCLVCGCKEDLVFCCGDYWCNDERCSTKESRRDEPYPKSEESCWAKHADYGYCDGGWRNAETFGADALVEEPDFIPDGDGRALGQQTSSINLSPLHAETEEAFGSVGEGNNFGQMRAENKVLSKTNLVIAGVIGLGIWKGKQILDTAKSSLKQSAENKKERCSTCNSNGTIRKNHTQVKQSEYSVNQINPVEAEGQNDIHGAEGVTNPRHAPNTQPFGYPSKSLKMW